MNCTDFELAVQNQLDARRIELSAELQAHHDECADCRSFYAAQLALVSVTKAWQSAAAPPEVAAAVLSELFAVPTERSPATAAKSRSRGLFAAACSAAVIVIISVALLRTPPTAQQAVTQQESSPASVGTPIVSDTLAGLLHGMNADYAALPAQTQRALENISELPESAPFLPEFSEANPPKLERPVEWRRWDRPVSDRVGQAFGFLWDALPQTSERSS